MSSEVSRLARRLPRWARTAVPVVVLAALGAVVTRLFVLPAQPTIERTDAVVVLDGGKGERLRRALELVEAGVTDTLVLSNVHRREHAPGRGPRCGRDDTLTVICFRPRPPTTAGEARTVAELAAQHGWEHLTVVTSTYHVLRSRVAFHQCSDVPVVMVPAGFGEGVIGGSVAILREMVALPIEVTLRRTC